MKKPSHECRHRFRSVGRDLEECPKCGLRQMTMGFTVEGVAKQKKTLAPNKIIPMLHG